MKNLVKILAVAAISCVVGCGGTSDPEQVFCEEAYVFPSKVPELNTWSSGIYTQLEQCFCGNFLPQIQNLHENGNMYADMCQSGLISENEILSWSAVSGSDWDSVFKAECASSLNLCREDQGK